MKLHALWQHIRGNENDALPDFAYLILLAAREKKHEKILSKISKYNQRLNRLVADLNASISETAETAGEEMPSIYEAHRATLAYSSGASNSETCETKAVINDPPYEVRQIINKLYKVLASSWGKTCNLPYKAILRLATQKTT